MVQAFPFGGIMNMDDPDGVIPSIHHKEAYNIAFKGTQPNLRAENIQGTSEVVNSYLPATGVNLTIGRYYDPIGYRIFFFNYNSEGKHGIYIYQTRSNAFQRVVENGINAEDDALLFLNYVIINNIDIIYGDSTQGDVLGFLDSVGRPKKININRALNGGYGTIKSSYMDIAKEPADIPPYLVYEDDPTVTVNNLRKKLFKFKIRWVFDDQDKSVTSSQSELPLPYDASNTTTDADPTKNCRISIVYQTGPANVKKIEIYAALSLGNTFSDFFLVSQIDKSVDNISNDDVSTFLFYNDKGYTYMDVEESIQVFDYVPRTARAQALLNGNVWGYGNITEGYPNLTDFSNGVGDTSNIAPTTSPFYYGRFFSLLVASQSGNSGFGTGNIHIVVRGRVTDGNVYTIYLTDSTSVSYEAQSGDDTAAVIEGLRVDAISEGFTIISAGDNDLYITKTNTVLSGFLLLPYVNVTSGENVANNSLSVYDWWSTHGFGLVYFDTKGRTNGTVYTDGFSVNSLPYSESISTPDIPRFVAYIYHRPPSWATYYQWVRTKDTTKSNLIQWISERTLKDTSTGFGQQAFAYVGIQSLFTFVSKNSGTPLGYSYTPNDRIRFIKLLDGAGATIQIYAQKDYEIVSLETNPTINGIDYIGSFVKLRLPSTDGTFDFGSSSFANYMIELYTPAQSVVNGLDVYYEFGERYAIGGLNTISRFHQGQLQNQTSNLVTPATFEFTKGDYYLKQRTIQTGQEIVYAVTSGFGSDSDAGRITLGLTPTSVSYSDPNITVGTSPYQNLVGFTLSTNTTRQILTIVSGTYTFRMTGTITITFIGTFGSAYPYEFFLQKNDGTIYQLVPQFNGQQAGTYTFQVDTTFTMTTGERIFIFGWSGNGNDDTRSFAATNLTVTREASFTQRCIDPNFSDYFPSAVNSNGRSFIYNSNANSVTFPVLYRWSLAYQTDTNINQSNRFYSQNFDELVRQYGAIKRMMVWNRVLTFFQQRKCSRVGIYQKFISDSGGNNQLITTSDIVTKNNVQYYAGEFGCGDQSDSIVQSGFVYYFVDPVKGKQLRLSADGITDLSEIYKTQTWAANNIINYLNQYNYEFGGYARITGTFNIRKDNVGEYLCVLQAGTSGEVSLVGQTMAFDESRNSFTSLYSYAPECIVCAENTLYSWRNGKMYIHDNTSAYNTFYGVYYDSTLTKVFNAGIIEKKSWLSLTEIANSIWDCPEIYTNDYSYSGTVQQSNLITQDFEDFESTYSASFLGDSNSVDGIINGDTLKGNLIVIKFRAPNAITLKTLTAINLYLIDSPLTNR